MEHAVSRDHVRCDIGKCIVGWYSLCSRYLGFDVVACADCCNAFHVHSSCTNNSYVMCVSRELQREFHKWGGRSNVTFDAAKYLVLILRCENHVEIKLKLFGVKFDKQLRMPSATG